jgi:hypothetical protein
MSNCIVQDLPNISLQLFWKSNQYTKDNHGEKIYVHQGQWTTSTEKDLR